MVMCRCFTGWEEEKNYVERDMVKESFSLPLEGPYVLVAMV